MGFSFAQFINPHGGPAAVRQYRERLQPSPELPAPAANVALVVLCANTEANAAQLRKAALMQFLRFEQGQRGPHSGPVEVAAYQFSALEQTRLAYHAGRLVSSTPTQVREQLLALAATYEVDELSIVTITADFADRLHSYELLAKTLKLPTGQLATA